MGKLTGKTSIVTGASSGIGATIAKHLAQEGAHVVLAARRKKYLDELAQTINQNTKGQALAIQTDVSKQTDVQEMVTQTNDVFGQIDIYVNNAGLMLDALLTHGKVDEWEQMIDVNIKGVLYGIHSVLPEMIERSTGHIINIASVSGFEVTKRSAVYSATKFAVRAISMGMEKELARTGVRVTNISPGMVDTNLTSRLTEERLNERKKSLEERTPLKPDDIARAVVYAVTQPDYVNVNEITVRPV